MLTVARLLGADRLDSTLRFPRMSSFSALATDLGLSTVVTRRLSQDSDGTAAAGWATLLYCFAGTLAIISYIVCVVSALLFLRKRRAGHGSSRYRQSHFYRAPLATGAAVFHSKMLLRIPNDHESGNKADAARDRAMAGATGGTSQALGGLRSGAWRPNNITVWVWSLLVVEA